MALVEGDFVSTGILLGRSPIKVSLGNSVAGVRLILDAILTEPEDHPWVPMTHTVAHRLQIFESQPESTLQGPMRTGRYQEVMPITRIAARIAG